MNTETGKIISWKDYDLLDTVSKEIHTEIKTKDMTKKQNESKQVSKHDARSILGKKFTTARAKRKWIAKQIKKQSYP